MTVPHLLPLTCRGVYCSSCRKIDVVWVACWYEPIFKTHQSLTQMEECSRFLPEWIPDCCNVCLWFPSDGTRTSPSMGPLPALDVTSQGREEEEEGELGGNGDPPWPLHGQNSDPKWPEPAIMHPLSNPFLQGLLHFLSLVPFFPPPKLQLHPLLSRIHFHLFVDYE